MQVKVESQKRKRERKKKHVMNTPIICVRLIYCVRLILCCVNKLPVQNVVLPCCIPPSLTEAATQTMNVQRKGAQCERAVRGPTHYKAKLPTAPEATGNKAG